MPFTINTSLDQSIITDVNKILQNFKNGWEQEKIELLPNVFKEESFVY